MIDTAVPYAIERIVDLEPADAIAQAKALLAAQGFGVQCEIDVAATLRAKTGTDIGTYVILGACKPDSALRVLDAEPRIGVLLPCNLVVRRPAGGPTYVTAVEAGAMLGFTGRTELAEVAADVGARLTAVLEGIGG